jgi:hypothetical protein
VSGNRYSHPDRANTIVTAGMLLLALLGVITVFHEPLLALFGNPAPSSNEAPPPLPTDEHGGAATAPRPR